jgi:hypothetical protein
MTSSMDELLDSIHSLLDATKGLEEIHEKVKAEFEKNLPGVDPHLVRGSDGRFVLLDSLTQIVNARATLVRAGME